MGTNLSKSVNCAYLFPRSVKISYFCSGPISVDPMCPQPTKAGYAPAGVDYHALDSDGEDAFPDPPRAGVIGPPARDEATSLAVRFDQGGPLV